MDSSTDDIYREVWPESDAWFRWLESARTFTFEDSSEDSSGHFTARKRRRWGIDYWYAARRVGRRLYETYLGRAQDITLERLHTVSLKLNPLPAATSEAQATQADLQMSVQPQHGNEASPSIPHTSITDLSVLQAHLPQLTRHATIDRLAAVTKYSLTVVSAPAGYGKTIVLTQWIATSRVPTAWLTLDEQDNAPVRLWTRVTSAFQFLLPERLHTADTSSTDDAQGHRSADVLLGALTAALHGVHSPVVLILDDYHKLAPDNSTIHAEVIRLLEHLPPLVHLVVASRTMPPLPLAQLRTRHRLLEFGTSDLQFTLAETQVFLCHHMKLDVSDEEIAMLHARTEGWVFALQLAAQSLQGQSDLHRWIADFSGENRSIFEYFMTEIVAHMPREMDTFTLQVSVLERLNGPLCDAVTQSNGGQAMLEEMERCNLFLTPLDDQNEWYHLHNLFADALRSGLRQAQPKLAPLLYARASWWCEANDLLLEAIDYAFAANTVERATQLVEAYASTALASGNVSLLREQVRRVPTTVVRERPRLCVAHAYTLYLMGERILWPQRVGDAEQAIAYTAHLFDPAELAVLQAEILALRTSIRTLLNEGSARARIAALRHALAALPPQHTFRSFIALYLGLNEAVEGNTRTAMRTLSSLMDTSEAQGDVFYIGYTAWYLGFAALLQGRLDEVRAICDRAMGYLVNQSNDGLNDLNDNLRESLQARIYLMRGKEFYERNHLEQALEQLRHFNSLPAEPAILLAEFLPTLAYTYLALGDKDAAQGVIEKCLAEWAQLQAKQKTGWVWIGRMIRSHQAHLWLLAGDMEAASRWAREIESLKAVADAGDGELPSYVYEWEEIVLARTYLAEHRLDKALALLESLRAAAEVDGRMSRLLEILTLRAAALDASGATSAAVQTLKEAVKIGALHGFVRTFVESGTPIQHLLRHIQADYLDTNVGVRQHNESRLQEYIDSLLNAFASVDNRPSKIVPAPAAKVEPIAAPQVPKLTPRQLGVLRLIASGASNDDIARELVIAQSTAKLHVSNILAALAVGRRTQAVARAQELGLLTTDG